MKKLGKLKLNSEKMLSYDELVSFRGGSGGGTSCSTDCTVNGVTMGCYKDSTDKCRCGLTADKRIMYSLCT
jgi:hypothetical protein